MDIDDEFSNLASLDVARGRDRERDNNECPSNLKRRGTDSGDLRCERRDHIDEGPSKLLSQARARHGRA
jgi:hypothetical protein